MKATRMRKFMRSLSRSEGHSFEIIGPGWLMAFIVVSGIVAGTLIMPLLPESIKDKDALKSINPIVYYIAEGVICLRFLIHIFNQKLCLSKLRYQNDIEDAFPNAITIPFSLFEGAFSRNPSVWILYSSCVRRNDELCVFSFKDYKKYKRFRKSLAEEADRVKMERERVAVKNERSLFEQDPETYLASTEGNKHEFQYETPSEEYETLKNDVLAYRQTRLIKSIMSDYQGSQEKGATKCLHGS